MQRSLIYPISTVHRYFQAASAQDLEFALSVFSVKAVRHRESLHFGVTLWKSAGGLIGGKTRKSRERFTTVAARHFSTTADRECPLIDSGQVWPTDLPRVACVQHLQPAVRLPASLVGHEEPIVRPPESKQLDYEGEIALVVGRRGRRIPESEALEHVAGYTICNEGTIRDWLRHKH